MSFDYTITNLKSEADFLRKEDDFFRELKLRAKLNRNYEDALVRRSINQKFNVEPVAPQERSILAEREDQIYQFQSVFKKLSSFLRPDVANEVLTLLNKDQILQLNLHFDAIKKLIPLQGRDVSVDYFLEVFKRYERFLTETGLTGIEIPSSSRLVIREPPKLGKPTMVEPPLTEGEARAPKTKSETRPVPSTGLIAEVKEQQEIKRIINSEEKFWKTFKEAETAFNELQARGLFNKLQSGALKKFEDNLELYGYNDGKPIPKKLAERRQKIIREFSVIERTPADLERLEAELFGSEGYGMKGKGVIGGMRTPCKEPTIKDITGIIRAGNTNPLLKKALKKSK